MRSKVLLAIAVITLISLGVIYYLAKGKPSDNVVDQNSGTPNTEDAITTDATAETSTIIVRSENKSEKLIFHNATGYTFSSYASEGVTDKVVVSFNGSEILLLGVNWSGYTQGSLPLVQVVPVKNKYIGDLFRATGGGIADRGYTLASLTKTSGKCTGNGDDMPAPCTDNDQVYGKNKVLTYLPYCSDTDLVAKCDELMSGLEITK